MLQTSNLVRKYKHICDFKKYPVQYQDLLNFADVSIFCIKKTFVKNSTFTQIISNENYVSYSLVLFSIFVRQKVTVNENVSFTDYTSGFRLPNCSKLAINPKNDKVVINSDITLSSDFFYISVFLSQVQLLVQVSRQYHDYFQSYGNFPLKRVDRKFRNRKYPHRNIAQHVETGVSQKYQICYECL